jgi:hypothetical protein
MLSTSQRSLPLPPLFQSCLTSPSLPLPLSLSAEASIATESSTQPSLRMGSSWPLWDWISSTAWRCISGETSSSSTLAKWTRGSACLASSCQRTTLLSSEETPISTSGGLPTCSLSPHSLSVSLSKGNEGYVKRRSNQARNVKQQPITCISSIEMTDSFLTGTLGGLLLLWTDVNCIRHVKAHQGAVNALFSSPHGILSGGKDARIRLWTHRLEPGATFDMSHFGLQPSIRSVCLSQDGSSILFGTKGAEIYEVSAVDGSDLRGGAIASGHSQGLLRTIAGLSSPPPSPFL